ncbi:uncharacterized protein [Typha latifolia]|uniref:uncharacterized protein n=1 Tax=Typha latifolia TaxID=4733 RepID=UPI003C2AD5F7
MPCSFPLSDMLVLLPFMVFFFPHLAIALQHNNLTDLSSLLSFKSHVHDPNGFLDSTWNSNTSFCSWTGVVCDPGKDRVIALQLHGFSLQGTISPYVGNLSFMAHLDLSNNSLMGIIPESVGHLPRIRVLDLYENQLSGFIPPSIFNMSLITKIALERNKLSGPLLAKNDSLMIPRIQFFSVEANQLIGTIPTSFIRCQELQILSLSTNMFSGTIPPELSILPKLLILYLDNNNLTGTIPASLGNLTYLAQFDLSANYLHGLIPRELGNLAKVQWLNLAQNSLTGEIPTSLSNASMINVIDLSINNLTGSVPADIGRNLPSLQYFSIGWNQLSGRLEFITSLSNCRELQNIFFLHNELGGIIPNSVANLSQNLLKFHARGNRIEGGIPAAFSNLSSLLFLSLHSNKLSGVITPEIAKLGGLQAFHLGYNNISGAIPPELGQLKRLSQLSLENNALSGSIPETVGNISTLEYLWLDSNELSSDIPRSMWSLSNLVGLYISQNSLGGIILADIGNLQAINQLSLSSNRLSGSIPDALGQLLMLEDLSLSNNSFEGLIPQSLGKLVSIKSLDLSSNEFSGPIPKSLADLHYLASLNLSFNKLEGQIPGGGVFSNITFQSLMGNAALCGGASSKLGFPRCPLNSTHSDSRAEPLHKLRIILPVVALALLLLFCSCYLFAYRLRRNRNTISSSGTPHLNEFTLVSYHELVRATDNFSESNLLGRGGSGSVYRGVLDDGTVAAIKVLNVESEGFSRIFDAECRALSMVRHRNLIRIISTCSNLDFKALILQFMPKGSLERWLYSPDCYLTLLQRMNIMLDAAQALEHLHHHHHQVVLHCDIKPSNVLLDEDMNAHLGDFGIAKLLNSDTKSMVSASAAGTVGYMPPEYGYMGRVSRRGDVYSYGMLMLETFTRKKPTDAMFGGEWSLRQWVFDACPNTLTNVLDGVLLRDESGDGMARHKCLLSMVELALECTKDSPKERILMKDVVPKLQKIKADYLQNLLEK